MGLSRRKFTNEFKEEAVRRLELGVSLAEVARAWLLRIRPTETAERTHGQPRLPDRRDDLRIPGEPASLPAGHVGLRYT